MDKYLEAEKRLAELLQPDCAVSYKDAGYFQWNRKHKPMPNFVGFVPQWCRDNAAAFALMVEYGLTVHTEDDATVCVHWPEGVAGLGFDYCDHPTKDTAVRYAIVHAVIAKLEQEI